MSVQCGAFCERVDNCREIPTYAGWKTIRTKGAQAIPEKTVEINGAKHKEQIFNGTKLLMVIMSAVMVLSFVHRA